MPNTYIDKFVRVVKKEMDRYGCDITIIRDISTSDDYIVQTSTAPVLEQEFPCRGILFERTLQSNGNGVYGNTLIEVGDKQLFIQPPEDDGFYQTNETDVIHPNRDRIRIGDKLYRVITFKQVNPSADNSVLFECYIRQ